MINKSEIVAGMTAAAVKDAGGSEETQLQRAQLAASLVERAEADERKRKAEDTLEPEAKWRRDTPKSERKAYHAPGPGMLGHIARWLNLK